MPTPRKMLLITTLLVLTLAPSSAFAAGTSFDTLSASVAARGWAVVADLNDPSVVFFNPGAMGFQKHTFNVYLGNSFVLPRIRYSDPEGKRPSANGTNTFTNVPNLHMLSNFGSRKQFSVGLSVVSPFGLASRYKDDWAGNTQVITSELKTIFFVPSFGYRINKYISLGVGLNLVYAQLRLKRGLALPFEDGSIGGYFSAGAKTFTAGANFGLQIRPTERLRIGFVYKSQTRLKFSGKGDFKAPLAFMPGLQDQDLKTQLNTPDNFWLGVGYWVLKNKLYFEFDARLTLWGVSSEKIVLTFSKPLNGVLTEQVINQAWRNSWSFYLSSVYKPIPALSLRFGLGFDMTPVPNHTLGPLVPDNNRVLASFGVGYEFSKIGLYIDTSYNLVRFLPRTVDAKTSEALFPQHWDNVVHLVTVNIGYHYR